MNLKKKQRRLAYDARNAQKNKDQLSHIICDKFISQLAYQQADTILWYLHCRSEVRTIKAVSEELNGGKRIVIPYCAKDQNGQPKLGLWRLEAFSELSPGTWGILEPAKARWGEKGKEISAKDLDLVMVPGVAFDRKGGRLGNGAGYYDRLLQEVRSDTKLTAVCYESQLFDQVLMEEHDVYMNAVLTEKNCYCFKENGF
jgi:5-formyltetrahydrofolate cyclo-ligase